MTNQTRPNPHMIIATKNPRMYITVPVIGSSVPVMGKIWRAILPRYIILFPRESQSGSASTSLLVKDGMDVVRREQKGVSN